MDTMDELQLALANNPSFAKAALAGAEQEAQQAIAALVEAGVKLHRIQTVVAALGIDPEEYTAAILNEATERLEAVLGVKGWWLR